VVDERLLTSSLIWRLFLSFPCPLASTDATTATQLPFCPSAAGNHRLMPSIAAGGMGGWRLGGRSYGPSPHLMPRRAPHTRLSTPWWPLPAHQRPLIYLSARSRRLIIARQLPRHRRRQSLPAFMVRVTVYVPLLS